MNIALDIDGVLNYIEQFQLKYGIPYFKTRGIDVVNPYGFDIRDIFGCTDEQRRDFWKSRIPGGKTVMSALLFELALHAEMRPGVNEMLKRLRNDGHRIYIITERYGTDKDGVIGSFHRKLVFSWLKKYGVIFPEKDIVFCKGDKKDEYIRLDIDVILEDNPKNLQALEEIDKLYAIVFNAGYNRDFHNDRVFRVDLPMEAYHAVRKIEDIKEEKEKKNKILRPGLFFPSSGKASEDRVYRQYIVEEDEDIEPPHDKMLDFLRKKAEKWPKAIIIEDEFGHSYSYDQFLNYVVPEYAKAFLNLGVKKGEPVIIALPNVIAVQASKFALNEIGAIPVVANPLSNKEEFKRYLTLDVAGVKPRVFLMFNRSFDAAKEALKDKNVVIEHVVCIGVNYNFSFPLSLGYALTQSKNDPSPSALKCDSRIMSYGEFINGAKKIPHYDKTPYEKDQCSIIYFTGGTTGAEKAVCITNENCIAIAEQFTKYIKGSEVNDITINAMPWFHVYGDNQIFYFAACNGMTNVAIVKFNRKDVDKIFNKYGYVVNYNGVPAFLIATRDNLTDVSRLSHIKNMISGGAPISHDFQMEMNKCLRRSGSKARVCVGYGITEGNGGVCFTLVGEDESGCIGLPTPGTNIKIVRQGTMEELPYGEIGEICFSGPSVMKGYLNNDEENKKALHRHDDGKIWFHSGDMGYAGENGLFYFSDRIKRMIIVSGENIYPTRIEKEILDAHGEIVDQCFVISRPDEKKGEVPVAKILLKKDVIPSEEIALSIMDTCRKVFKNKKYWPVAVDFIRSVPMTKMSKADLKKIDDPRYRIELGENSNKTREKDSLKRYAENRFYKAFSDIYSPMYRSKLSGRQIEYIGMENIPEKGAGIIAMNHLDAHDQNAVLAYVDRIISLPSKKEYFDNPLHGFFMTKMDMIPVDRYGDLEFAKKQMKGLIKTTPVTDFEKEYPVIEKIVGYVNKLPKEEAQSPKKLVECVTGYISRNYPGDPGISIVERINEMPVSGEDNGYGRAMKINEEIMQRLNAGRLIAVFPEGTRNKHFEDSGKLLPFKNGISYWARDSYAPVIPVAITGDHKRGGKLIVRCGTPLRFSSDMDIKDITEAIQFQVYRLVLQNLLEQENRVNDKALEKAIVSLKEEDSEKSAELLQLIKNGLNGRESARNKKLTLLL